jgi:O-antigen ligase
MRAGIFASPHPRDVAGPALGLAALIATALVAGVLVVGAPAFALALAAGVAFTALVPANLTVGLAAFTVIQYLAVLPYPHAHGVSLFKLLIGLLVLTWLGTVATARLRRRAVGFVAAEPILAASLVLFFCVGTASIAWAPSPAAVLSDLQRYGLNFALFPIVFSAVLMKDGARIMSGAIAVGGAVAVLGGLVSGGFSASGRLTGTIGDANDIAAQLVPAMIIALALAFTSTRPARRLCFGAIALICDAGIVLTLSRGGLVAAATGLVAWCVFGGRWRPRIAASLAGLAVLGALAYGVAVPPAARGRVSSLGGGSGRVDIWRLGWRAFLAEPVRGGGLGNFTRLTPRYVIQPGAIESNSRFLAVPKVAHNAYLHVLTETGVLGEGLLLVIVLTPLAATVRAARLFSAGGMLRDEGLARGVFGGMVGILTANFFISGQYQKPLWLVLALGPPLAVLARRGRIGIDSVRL